MDYIIKKNSQNTRKNKLYSKRLFIDSRLRNKSIYKYSYDFKIILEQSYKNVKALELRNINIDLNNQYLINNNNNKFEIEFYYKYYVKDINVFVINDFDITTFKNALTNYLSDINDTNNKVILKNIYDNIVQSKIPTIFTDFISTIFDTIFLIENNIFVNIYTVNNTNNIINLSINDNINTIIENLVKILNNTFIYKKKIKQFKLDNGDYNFEEYLINNSVNKEFLLGKKIVDIINTYLKPYFSGIDIKYEILEINNKIMFKNIVNDIKIKFLSYNEDSLAHILGFKPDIYYSRTGDHIISDYQIKLKKEKYAILYINDYDIIYSNKNSIINGFYIIQNNNMNNLQCLLDKNIKYFSPYIDYIDKIDIKLKDYYGNFINLNNNNFSFELILYYYN